MKSLLVCIACLVISACGAEPEYDPELKVLLDHFLKFAPNSGKLELVDSIEFKALGKERGYCKKHHKKLYGQNYAESRSIRIDPRIGVAPLPVIFFHELGHCLFDLPHSSGKHDIMYVFPQDGADYWTPEQIDTGLQAMFLGLHL